MRRAALLLALACTAGAALAERPAVLPATMEQRLLACASCHARPDRNDAFYPRISGKPAGYLYNQLVNFKDGKRQFPMMTYMVSHLPDDYLRDIADHFSKQHLPAPAATPPSLAPAVLERGRMLALHGDASLRVPACVACHGKMLTGVAPAIPGLLGLPRDYVNAQFGAWKNKTRRAHAPDCMAGIADRLSLADISAVSGWLAHQPVPKGARPDTAIARPLPVACGSSPDGAP
ncbi:MAG: c-type cytochrome [Telluria sp.]